MKFLFFILSVCFSFFVNGQEVTLHEFISKQFEYYNYPIQIVAQNDSSVVVLSEIEGSYGRDLQLTKYIISDTQAVYERKLYLDTLFNGRFNQKEVNFHFFENNGVIAFVVEKKMKNKAVIYGRTITSDGKMSNCLILDSIEKRDKNLESFNYDFYQTANKKNIIIVCHRNYLSGFRRDKCLLLSVSGFDKNLETDLPKNSIGISENYNFETDFQNNLFYAVYNMNAEIGDSLIIFKVESRSKLISQFKILKHARLTNFKALFSNQILVYGIINLYFENNDSLKKALYFERINLNNGQIIMDTTILLSPINQANLSYRYKSLDNDPLSKLFTLVSDDIIDGHLINVYEHKHNALALNDLNRRVTRIDPTVKNATITENLEYLVSSFNLTTNQLDFVSLVPKKIIYNTNRYEQQEINPFSSTYFNGDINLSFYENRANINIRPNKPHRFNAFNQVSNLTDMNTVNYSCDNKNLISFNLHGYWRPLNSQQTKKCNKTYYFNYTKHYLGVAYYNLSD